MRERVYMVSALTGQAGGLEIHRFKVQARDKTLARQRVSRSSRYSVAWDGQRLRRFEADPWEPWMDEVGDVTDLTP